MCQNVFASCDVIIRNTWSHTWRAVCQGLKTQDIQDPTKQRNPKSSPYLDCKQNCGVLSPIIGFTVGAKLWRINQRQSSGSCDRASGASAAILSHHIQSAFYTSCVHKGELILDPLPLSHSPLLAPHNKPGVAC